MLASSVSLQMMPCNVCVFRLVAPKSRTRGIIHLVSFIIVVLCYSL